MGQIFLPENIPALIRLSGTAVTLAATSFAASTRINVSGQQYSPSGLLTLSTGTTGLNGLDTGSLGASQTWYVYAVINSAGVLGLVASLSSSNPSVNAGYTATSANGVYRMVGSFVTDGSNLVSAIVSGASATYPVPASLVSGRTDGVAVVVPLIGEKQEVSLVTTSVVTPTENTIYDTTGTLSLTPGVWIITAKVNMQGNSTSDNNLRIPWFMAILRDEANNIITQAGFNHIYSLTVANPGFAGTLNLNAYALIAATTSYKVSIKWMNVVGGTITVSSFSVQEDAGVNAYYGNQYIRAVRIA